MTVFICDPGFSRRAGHHLRWNTEFINIFRCMGEDVYLLAHRNYPDGELDGAPVLSFFKQARGHEDNLNDLMYNWDRYLSSTRNIYFELVQLTSPDRPKNLPVITAHDIFVFPTILQMQLSGIVQWFSSLPDEARPTVLCYLMGPSGCLKNTDGTYSYHSFDTARYYKLAFRTARQAAEKGKAELHFFACGESHAEQYSFLRGEPVRPYALLNTAIQPDHPPRETPAKAALLYMGDPHERKGVGFVPGIVEAVCLRHSDWQFTVHLGMPGVETEPLKAFKKVLEGLEQKFRNFKLIYGRLDDETYCTLMNNSELVLTPYNPVIHLNHTSGVVWEAVATANTLVVPANCWLEAEATRLGASHVAFEEYNAASIADAVSKAISSPPRSRQQKIEAAQKFKNRNHYSELKAQIMKVWTKRQTVGKV